MALGASWVLAMSLVVMGVVSPLVWMIVQSFSVLFSQSSDPNMTYLLEMIKFTFLQSLVSGAFSIVLGGGLALMAAGKEFPFRRFLKGLSLVPYSFPAVVVAVAFILSFGQSGFLGTWFGENFSFIYSAKGVVAAHVFMNAPFVFSTLLVSLESLPQSYEKQARMLSLSIWQRLRFWIWPEVSKDVWGLFLSVVLTCVSSFSIVLILGGSPQLATLEVGIYSSIKSDGNFQNAAFIGLIQLLLVAPLIYFLRRLTSRHKSDHFSSVALLPREIFSSYTRSEKLFFLAFILAYLAVLSPPLASILMDGLKGLPQLVESRNSKIFGEALWGTAKLSLVSSSASVLVAWAYGRFLIDMRGRLPAPARFLSEVPWLMMAFSPALLGAFWLFLAIEASLVIGDMHFYFLVLAHFMMVFPLAFRVIFPALDRLMTGYSKPLLLLDLSDWQRLRHVEWPEIKVPLLAAFGLGIALSLSEVSTVLLLSGGSYRTLSTLVFELMGSYRFSFAATVALCIGAFSVFLAFLLNSGDAKHDGGKIG
jgi:thiamine transport system permease protein